MYQENGNDLKLILKGKSDLRIPFHNNRGYLQEAFYYKHNYLNFTGFLSFKDISYEDKNLGSIKCGLIKTIRLGNSNNLLKENTKNHENKEYNFLENLKNTINNYYSNFDNNSLLKKTESNNFIDLSLGFKLDRPLYGISTSNSFSNRNFINFIIGLENNKFSLLTKLKYPEYERNNLFAKTFFRFKVDENAKVLIDFSYDKKNNLFNYNFGAEVLTEDNSVIKFNINEKNEISQQLTMQYNNQIKFNFKNCISLASGFIHEHENNLNPELYLNAKLGFGIEFTIEDKKIGNKGYGINKSDHETDFGQIVFESINNVCDSLWKFVKRLDIY